MVEPRRRWLLVLGATVVAVGLAVWFARPDGDDVRVVSVDSARDGWQRLGLQGIEVEVPEGWSRQDSDGCLGIVEHWGPPTEASCGYRPGVTFSRSSTFDSSTEHGAVTRSDDPGAPAWFGSVVVGDVAVSASDDDRRVVRDVLDSASAPGFQTIG